MLSIMQIISSFVFVTTLYSISCDQGCESARKCGECIGFAAERCVWCAAPDDKYSGGPRCQSKATIKETWCKDYINDPEHKINISKSEEFTPGNESMRIPAVQLKPQEVVIKARPRVPVTFELSFKPAKDFPLDVYFLMDFSWTMKQHFENLKNQCLGIYKILKSYTNNVQLGVGSFVEKPGFPYVDTKLHNAYIFKNHLSLTSNMSDFQEKIKNVNNIGYGNYDDQEAILDGLMQAMVCDEVKWRNGSRRIIVASTDGPYHSAGDGKMVGAVIPNNMKCHKDNESAVLYDYPSVSQINKVASEHYTKIIFAVTDNVAEEYKNLKHPTINLAEYAKLNDKSDIIKLIEDVYKKSNSHLKLFYKAPENIVIKLNPSCNGIEIDNCLITHRGIVNVTVTLMAMACQPPTTATIGLLELGEYVDIKVTVDCQCDCELPGKGTKNSKKCNSVGLEQCGVCTECNADRYGEFCQCNGTDTSKTNLQNCKMNNTTICSNHGECICGTCECYGIHHGTFCEYNGQECPYKEGKQCSGHGICQFAKCKCEDDWMVKEDCSCTSLDTTCKLLNSEEICSGKGICECGSCRCESDQYVGDYCECSKKNCEDLGDYVMCNYENKKNQTICDEKYKEIAEIDFVNKTELNSQNWPDAQLCKKELGDGSLIIFRSHCRSVAGIRKLHVIIQDEKEILPVASVWIPVGATIGAILLIGLITIIVWKYLVDMYDAREYKKFEKESKDAGFDVNINPHYREPRVNFSNPAYNSDQ